MKACVCRSYGPPESLTLEDVPVPRPGPGEVLVRVRAAGINFADHLMIAGRYQDMPPLPFIPGFEAAGEIAEVGPGVDGFAPGDRVATLNRFGGYAEFQVSPADGLVKLPDEVSFETAAAATVAYGTADVALRTRLHLRPNEWLLVTGAGGGAGLAAVNLGHFMGAKVIALAGSGARLAAARAAGAVHIIDHRAGDVATQIQEITGGQGVDAAYDTVGGAAFRTIMKSITFEGRIAVIGFASGDIPSVPAGHLLVKNATLCGIFWGAYKHKRRDLLKESLAHVFDLAAMGLISPQTGGRYPLEAAPQALGRLTRREAVGKLILTL